MITSTSWQVLADLTTIIKAAAGRRVIRVEKDPKDPSSKSSKRSKLEVADPTAAVADPAAVDPAAADPAVADSAAAAADPVAADPAAAAADTAAADLAAAALQRQTRQWRDTVKPAVLVVGAEQLEMPSTYSFPMNRRSWESYA
jgi:hypothetical protein